MEQKLQILESEIQRRMLVKGYLRCPYCNNQIDKIQLEEQIITLKKEIEELRKLIPVPTKEEIRIAWQSENKKREEQKKRLIEIFKPFRPSVEKKFKRVLKKIEKGDPYILPELNDIEKQIWNECVNDSDEIFDELFFRDEEDHIL